MTGLMEPNSLGWHPFRDAAHPNNFQRLLWHARWRKSTKFQRLIRRCSRALLSVKGVAEHKRRQGHQLQPTMFSNCDWNLASMAERVGLPLCRFKHPPTQVLCATCHLPAYLPCSSPATMGEWRSDRWRRSLAIVVTSLHVGDLWDMWSFVF